MIQLLRTLIFSEIWLFWQTINHWGHRCIEVVQVKVILMQFIDIWHRTCSEEYMRRKVLVWIPEKRQAYLSKYRLQRLLDYIEFHHHKRASLTSVAFSDLQGLEPQVTIDEYTQWKLEKLFSLHSSTLQRRQTGTGHRASKIDQLCIRQLALNIFWMLYSCLGRKGIHHTMLKVFSSAWLLTMASYGEHPSWERKVLAPGHVL